MLDSEKIQMCGWCDEPILRGDGDSQGAFLSQTFLSQGEMRMVDYHRECWFRLFAGSVAHIERRCSCFVDGATEADPPQMTLREAARAALAAWNLRNPPTGDD